jgi:hypothetical protein
MRVENYITHNGDFDFYNGTTYDLEVIQNFLSIVLGPMPATVDSCAVAGMVDCYEQGLLCFECEIRYLFGTQNKQNASRHQLSSLQSL